MNKSAELIKYLIDHKIDFYQSNNGPISIPINKIPNDIRHAFHKFCYNLQKSVSIINNGNKKLKK